MSRLAPWARQSACDKEHRIFLSRQGCLVCGRTPCDAHHLAYTQPRALGKRVSDEYAVPVCRIHHRELHLQTDEIAWWNKFQIDPVPIALRLWQRTRFNSDEPAPNEATPLQTAKTADVSAQNREVTNVDAPNSSSNRIDQNSGWFRFTEKPAYIHERQLGFGCMSAD